MTVTDPHAPTTPAVAVDTPTQATQSGRAATAPADPEIAIAIGERLGGRYLVTAFLGEGGMGAVYRAVDEKLGEDVALKVVRGTARVDALADETRLAQKVTHPNVCRTYDLEEVGGHQLVKMEYVAGDTLVARLAALGRLAIDDAVRIARAIADGLAAAHAQGIVHRDLKPANVMLSGERVVLMDFGVARRIASASGKTAGTLGYMAPEQIANLAVDGAADLYALGCVLYEMLAGERVFASDNKIELAVRHVSVPAPDVRAVRADTPRWLARAVARLLAKEPGQRALGVAALRAGPRRLRRFALPAAAVAIAVLGAGLAWSARTSAPPPCTDIDQRLAGVWDPAVRAAVHDAFAKTKRPFAGASFDGVARVLDGYSASWVAAVTDSCRATRVRKEQTEEVLSLREDCLDERFEELRALTKLLADADGKLVENASKAASSLEPLARCANVAMLRAPGLPPPEIAAAVRTLGLELAKARGQWMAGQVLPALVASQQILDKALAMHWDPIAASAYDTRCAVLLAAGNIDEAIAACKEATWAGMRGKRDDVVATAALSMAVLLAQGQRKPREAEIWVELGSAAAVRVGTRQLDARRYEIASTVAAERGDTKTAVAMFEKAYAAVTQELGSKDSLQLMWIESDFGSTLANAGACELAIPHFEHALAIGSKALGSEHPEIARELSNLGLCYRHSGQLAKAHDALAHSLAIREHEFGKKHPFLVASLDNFAEVLGDEGDLPGALAMMARAKDIAQVVPGTANPVYQQIATDQGRLLVLAGKLADARALYDETIALERAASSDILPKTLTARANLALVEHQWPEAAGFAEQAITGFEAEGGKEQPELWQPLTALARAKHAQHDDAAARALLDRAAAIADKGHIPEHDLTPLRATTAELRVAK